MLSVFGTTADSFQKVSTPVSETHLNKTWNGILVARGSS